MNIFQRKIITMNKTIKTLHDALAYHLQRLLYAERKIREEFKPYSHHISSDNVKGVTQGYINNANNVELKLDRVFNYLMLEPIAVKNEIIDKMVEETQHLLTYTSTSYLKDILMIGCIKNINAYKTASFQTAYLMALEMELGTPADLIHQILEWELAMGKQLYVCSIHEFNTLNDSARVK
jgi:ferritin-like metal-binding protein YciE